MCNDALVSSSNIEVAAIVVCFNPVVEHFVSNVDALLEQFSAVLIVDNSEDLQVRRQLMAVFCEKDGVHFIQLDENYGIAVAQNIGIRRCIELGFRYFCEFDQDSTIEQGYALRLLCSYFSLSSSNKIPVAAVGPNAIDSSSGQSYRFKGNVSDPFSVETTLSSGLLVSVEAYLSIGPKDEGLFIDLVDWEWCFRALDRGFQIYVDPAVCILHKLGERHDSLLGFFIYGVPAPFRHYYAFRNYIRLVGRSYVPLRWKLKYFLINTCKFLLYPFLMDSGFSRFKYMCLGISDGISGKFGRL